MRMVSPDCGVWSEEIIEEVSQSQAQTFWISGYETRGEFVNYACEKPNYHSNYRVDKRALSR